MALNAYPSCEWKIHFLDKVFFDPAICSMKVMPNLCYDFLIVLPLGYFIKILPKNIFLYEILRTPCYYEELLNLNMLKAMN